MKLGFVSAILGDLKLAEVLQFAAEADYQCVEVMCWPPSQADRRYAGVTHIDCTSIGPAEIKDIQRQLAETGIQLSGLGYYPNPLSPNRDEAQNAIDHLQRVIRVAGQLEVRVVNTFVGRDPNRSPADNWPRFREVWPSLVRLAEREGVKIGIENCPMLFSHDEWPGGKNLAVAPEIWRRMFSEIPSTQWGLNYDPSHMVWQQMDYLKPIAEFKDRLVHIHAKDVRLDRGRLDEVGILALPAAYHVPKLPGLGDVNWGQFFSLLTDVGYRGPVCVEVEDRAYEDSLESRQASLRQSATYLRNFVPRR